MRKYGFSSRIGAKESQFKTKTIILMPKNTATGNQSRNLWLNIDEGSLEKQKQICKKEADLKLKLQKSSPKTEEELCIGVQKDLAA